MLPSHQRLNLDEEGIVNSLHCVVDYCKCYRHSNDFTIAQEEALRRLILDILRTSTGDLRKLLKNRRHRPRLPLSLLLQLLRRANPYCGVAASLAVVPLQITLDGPANKRTLRNKYCGVRTGARLRGI